VGVITAHCTPVLLVVAEKQYRGGGIMIPPLARHTPYCSSLQKNNTKGGLMTPLTRHTPVLLVVTEKPYRGVMTPLPPLVVPPCCSSWQKSSTEGGIMSPHSPALLVEKPYLGGGNDFPSPARCSSWQKNTTERGGNGPASPASFVVAEKQYRGG
jgi:hypothetical protein